MYEGREIDLTCKHCGNHYNADVTDLDDHGIRNYCSPECNNCEEAKINEPDLHVRANVMLLLCSECKKEYEQKHSKKFRILFRALFETYGHPTEESTKRLIAALEGHGWVFEPGDHGWIPEDDWDEYNSDRAAEAAADYHEARMDAYS